MVWSRHDFTINANETADRWSWPHSSALILRNQIEAWINEGGAGGEPPE